MSFINLSHWLHIELKNIHLTPLTAIHFAINYQVIVYEIPLYGHCTHVSTHLCLAYNPYHLSPEMPMHIWTKTEHNIWVNNHPQIGS